MIVTDTKTIATEPRQRERKEKGDRVERRGDERRGLLPVNHSQGRGKERRRKERNIAIEPRQRERKEKGGRETR